MTVVISLLLVLCVLALFLPLLSRKAVPEFYISSTPAEDREREQTRIKAMLADLRQEYDAGKIPESEFTSMAAELLADLDRIAAVSKSSAKRSSKRLFCDECGAVRPPEVAACSQCGAEFK
ncbi:MAG: hypothetical protein JNM27_20355 [Leptospirales bacterium]|nr:hypothetical protein [Leptospirales bacterium]